jgi:hypothetical protein
MILYNVTIQPLWEIHDQWLHWMRNEHVPEIMHTGLFTHHRILRLLDVDESEGPTYAFQYYASSREKYDQYISQFAKELRAKTYEKWGEKFIAFRSLMQVVE